MPNGANAVRNKNILFKSSTISVNIKRFITRFILYEDDHKRLHYLDLISIFVPFITYFILLGFLNISDIGLGIVI